MIEPTKNHFHYLLKGEVLIFLRKICGRKIILSPSFIQEIRGKTGEQAQKRRSFFRISPCFSSTDLGQKHIFRLRREGTPDVRLRATIILALLHSNNFHQAGKKNPFIGKLPEFHAAFRPRVTILKRKMAIFRGQGNHLEGRK
ncbi:MAG: hypothetical protein ACI382_03585 [Alloprevotella sp.]